MEGEILNQRSWNNISELLSSVISAGATIVAAKIALSGAKKIVETVKKDGFTSYSEDSFDAFDVIRHAKKNIIIVANSGGNFLEKYESVLRSYMKKGIDIYYLIQTFEGCAYMDRYLTGEQQINIEPFRNGINIMKRFNKEYSDKFHIRYIDSFFTASYITVDVDLDREHDKKKQWYDEKTSVVHVMLYQYGKQTSRSPIFHIDSKTGEQYTGTLESILNLWHSGSKADEQWLAAYENELDKVQEQGYAGYDIKFEKMKA